MLKIIAYYRVSTKRQGQSGLGLEAQRAAVIAYAKSIGATIVAEYVEIESGKRHDNRPQLALAISHARGIQGQLVIARLDRLARNVSFDSALMESGANFICCDNPSANRLTLHVLAAVAEAEAKAISERTKAALLAAKQRGIVLGAARIGHPNCGKYLRKAQSLGTLAATTARRQRCNDAYGFLLPEVRQRRLAGQSLATIADWLNENGHRTTRGLNFTATAVHRILARTTSQK